MNHFVRILFVLQDQWVRSDGVQPTREDLMITLSQLDYIIIKAEYAKETRESRLENKLRKLTVNE